MKKTSYLLSLIFLAALIPALAAKADTGVTSSPSLSTASPNNAFADSKMSAVLNGQGLTLDVVPDFDFGTHMISSTNQIYDALADGTSTEWTVQSGITPNTANTTPLSTVPYAQVTDLRGTDAGWALALQQEYQFKDARNNKLNGAQITYSVTNNSTNSSAAPLPSSLASSQQLIPMDTYQENPVLVAMAQASSSSSSNFGEGVATNVLYFGQQNSGAAGGIDSAKSGAMNGVAGGTAVGYTSGVVLSVPQNANPTTSTYTTTLLWTLYSGPIITSVQ